jgi:hypothetical protein
MMSTRDAGLPAMIELPAVQCYGIVAERKQRQEALGCVDQFAKRSRIIYIGTANPTTSRKQEDSL